MVTAEVTARKKSYDIILDFADDPVPLEILNFFEKHSRTRFDRLAIFHALSVEGQKAFPDRALRGLIEQGMVKECVENGVPLYSLNLSSR